MLRKGFSRWSKTALSTEEKFADGKQSPASLQRILIGGIGGFISVASLALLVDALPQLELLLIGSFGASAVLLFGAPYAPFSQPRNVLGGHLVSALVGILCYTYLPALPGLQEGAAVGLATILMLLTRTMHPPGGATGLIAVIGSEYLHALGWKYLLLVAMGMGVLLLLALIINNLVKPGSYPQRWD